MIAVDPAEFYKAHIDQEKEYVRVYPAYEIKAGEEINLGDKEATATEDGYVVGEGNRSLGENLLLDKKQFAAKTRIAADLELPLPKEDFDEDMFSRIEFISEGVPLYYPGIKDSERVPAPRDGVALTDKDGAFTFMSNYRLITRFNYQGIRFPRRNETVVALSKEEPVKGILIDREIDIDFKPGIRTVRAGTLLYADPHSEDRYSLRNFDSPNADLRIATPWADERFVRVAHETAAERQKKLKALARGSKGAAP